MAWQRKRKERKRGGRERGRKGKRGEVGRIRIQSTRGKQENGKEHILKPMLIYLSSQIKQFHKENISKSILEVIF